MDNSVLTSRRITSTLAIALIPLFSGLALYSYWLFHYYSNFDLTPLGGKTPTLGFWLLVLAVPANILGLVFLYIPYSKNKDEVKNDKSLKNKFLGLLFLLLLNYVVAGGLIYNFVWLNSTISIEFENNYSGDLTEMIVVLPNGDGIRVNYVPNNMKGNIRVFSKGEGPVEFIVRGTEGKEVRKTVIGHITSKMGGRIQLRLSSDFELINKSEISNDSR
jgi:hypothetical protein